MNFTTTSELLEIYCRHPYISTDSRKVMPGSIYFALKGDNFNGNLFARAALENGAAYAVIDEQDQFTGERTLLVENVLGTLQSLASLYRSTLKIPIIGITGTNGKTTTKELMAAALSSRFITVATPGNFNNHLGVPLTLLSIKPDTEIAVVEMGANHPGEIASLCMIARPTHGLITNIGKAHLEGFGGFEGVIRAKNELYQYLNENGGRVFVNSGDELLMKLSAQSYRITYGTATEESVPKSEALGTGQEELVVRTATNGVAQEDEVFGTASTDEEGYLVVELKKPLVKRFRTRLAGAYNADNVMAALCIANHFKVTMEKAVAAVASYVPGMNRSQIFHSASNVLILDAYNANPSSMRIAIENFSQLPAVNKVMILGDMFELGAESDAEHREIVRIIQTHAFTKVYTAGPHFFKAADGMEGIERFNTTEELRKALVNKAPVNSTILIKGSRGMKLETITDLL